MSLTAFVVCLALQAGPVEVGPEFVTPPPKVSDDARVKRVAGAFLGGIVGFAAGTALISLGGADCFGSPVCITGWHGVLGALVPFVAATGAWAGFKVMGGDGGWLTPVAALAPAALMALALHSVARDMDANTTVQMLPFLAASGLVFSGTAALLMELRAQQLEALGSHAEEGSASPGRVALESLVSLFAAAPLVFGTGLLTFALAFSGVGIAVPALIAAASLSTLAVAATTYGVHRALGGRGSFWSSVLGLGVGWVIALGGGALYALAQSSAFNSIRVASSLEIAVELGVAAAMFSPVFALELSHTSAVASALPKVTLGATPVREGGMVAASMQF